MSPIKTIDPSFFFEKMSYQTLYSEFSARSKQNLKVNINFGMINQINFDEFTENTS